MNQKITINISTKTIIKIILAILGFVFLYHIREIILLVFAVLVIVAGLDPTLIFFDKYKIPRWISVSLLYSLLAICAILLFYIIMPPAIEQISNLINNIPDLVDKFPIWITSYFNKEILSEQQGLFSLSRQLQNTSSQIVGYVISFFGSITATIIVLVFSFYLLLKHESVEEIFFAFIPKAKRKESIKIYKKISTKLGNWLRSRIILSVIIFTGVFIFLKVLDLPYALTLALLAGVLDIIPIIGPIIAGIIMGLIICATGSWWQVAVVLGLYIILMQIEASFLVPKMMGKAIGLSPVIIILVFAIGIKLGGIVGAILSIPIAAGVYVIIQEWISMKKILFD